MKEDYELLKKYLQNEIDIGNNKTFIFDKDNVIDFKNCNALSYIENMEKEIERLNNIINKLKWKPIEEYDKGNYDWVLVKYFDKDFECIPCVAEKRFDKWHNRNDEVIEFDVKYFMDMQQIDKLQELKGSDK